MQSALERKAESYLNHILIAARVEDRSSGLWRSMLDNWNCYTRGHPFVAGSGDGQPHWFNKARPAKHSAALLAMHARSVRADLIIKERRDEVLAVDHVVPVNVLRDMMIELAPSWGGAEDVRLFLKAWYRLCVITPDEHARLNSKAFHTTRYDPERLFDRYRSAGIDLIAVPPGQSS